MLLGIFPFRAYARKMFFDSEARKRTAKIHERMIALAYPENLPIREDSLKEGADYYHKLLAAFTGSSNNYLSTPNFCVILPVDAKYLVIQELNQKLEATEETFLECDGNGHTIYLDSPESPTRKTFPRDEHRRVLDTAKRALAELSVEAVPNEADGTILVALPALKLFADAW